MNRNDSLTAYHKRRHAEVALEVERLRRSAVHEEPCSGPRVGPVISTLAVIGGVVVGAAILTWLFGDN